MASSSATGAAMDQDGLLDFSVPDDLCSVVLQVEGQKLYTHREILAAWSPVFRSMFTQDFKEREMREIDLPGKKAEDFVELLHCIYPPIKPIGDYNVYQLLPLAEEYQITEIKKNCEEYLLTKEGSMELLVIAQTYNLTELLSKCIEFARCKSFLELREDPHFACLMPDNLIAILQVRVQDLERKLNISKKMMSERDVRLFGCITDMGSGYGGFCTECKSRKVNESCLNCMRMFKDKVKNKCDELKGLRNTDPFKFS